MIEYIRILRPRQWVKNSLVFAAMIFARHYSASTDWMHVFATFAGFCLTASSIYIINDAFDIDIDRLHPRKMFRPLAAGKIKILPALIYSALLLIAGLLAGLWVNQDVFLILAGYAAVMMIYSYKLKHILLLDVFIIAGGLTARAVIGAVAIDVLISKWLLVCTFFISIMLALTKRRQELAREELNPEKVRKSLRNAPAIEVWDRWIMMMAGVSILAYTLYTMDPATVEKVGSQDLLFTMPFVVFAVFRYQVVVYSKNTGEDPTETLLTDKWIIGAIICWLISVLLVLTANR